MVATRARKCSICHQSGHNSRTCDTRITTNPTVASDDPGKIAKPDPEPSADGKVDLGELGLGDKRIFVSLLPTQAESVMVKYDPEIQISCVIPPQELKICYAAKRHLAKKYKDINIPTLIMSCGYTDVPSTKNYVERISGYTLWAIDTAQKERIYAKSYVFANVWTNGNICFGALHPKSLRQAYNQYWSSNFNDDLFREQHVCNLKNHQYFSHRGHRCNPFFKSHICDCPKVTFHKHLGCGCTAVGTSKKCKGSCSSEFGSTCDCCIAINNVFDTARQVDPNISPRKLAKLDVVEDEPYPGCGCNFRHKRGCACRKNTCNCECLCPCCTSTCTHEECRCSCCRNSCGCQCSCSIQERFEKHINDYHEITLPSKAWDDRTNFFCGVKFWASSDAPTGVLVTDDPLLLKQIPRKYWRARAGRPLLIAAASYKDGGWTFYSKAFKFSLKEGNILVK